MAFVNLEQPFSKPFFLFSTSILLTSSFSYSLTSHWRVAFARTHLYLSTFSEFSHYYLLLCYSCPITLLLIQTLHLTSSRTQSFSKSLTLSQRCHPWRFIALYAFRAFRMFNYTRFAPFPWHLCYIAEN